MPLASIWSQLNKPSFLSNPRENDEIVLSAAWKVFNPKQIIYGKIPDYFLSDKGCKDIQNTQRLSENGPFEQIYASQWTGLAKVLKSSLPLSGQLSKWNQESQRQMWKFSGRAFTKLPMDYLVMALRNMALV